MGCSRIFCEVPLQPNSLIICPILKMPICYTCKQSDQFRMITCQEACKRFSLDYQVFK